MSRRNGHPPTEYKLTSATDTKAVVENPTHDHPKIITSEKDATIEGDEGGRHKKQQFRFEKKKLSDRD